MLLDYLPLQEPELVTGSITFAATSTLTLTGTVVDAAPAPQPAGTSRPRLVPRAAPPAQVVTGRLTLTATSTLRLTGTVDDSPLRRRAAEDELVLIDAL